MTTPDQNPGALPEEVIDPTTLEAPAVVLTSEVPAPAPSPAAPDAAPEAPAVTAEQIAEATAAPAVVEVVMAKQNIKQAQPVFLPEPKFDHSQEIVPLPSNHPRVVAAKIAALPEDAVADDEQGVKWATVVNQGGRHASFEETHLATLEQQDAEFVQEVDSPAGLMRASHPKLPGQPGEVVKGALAVQRLNTYLGLGGLFRFPLYNSGIWVTVKPPPEGSILELNRQNIADKILFGRQTYGLAANNMSSVIADRLVSFVIANLHSTSLEEGVDPRDVISSQDIPTLIWGIANATYPNGFQYQRACTCDPAKCQHVIEERLALSKILWTNQRALSKMQLAHLANNGTGKMSLKSVQEYQLGMLIAQKRQITVTSSIGLTVKMTLRVPSVTEYVESGNRWIADISKTVNAALGADANDVERNNFMVQNGQAGAMRQYIHWVENIEFDGQTTDGRDTNERLFGVLSQDDTLRDEFMDKVGKYVDESQISVIGIPVYDCPKCGGENKAEKELPHATNIIPLDAYQTFFTLLVQRIERIQAR